jgi:outer membrane murein-binding lipoprotein Lpp
MNRKLIALIGVIVVGLLLAGCTSSNNNNKKTVSTAQKTTVETGYDISAALADTVEALDGMIASTGFSNGTGGSVTVDGHGSTSVALTWTGAPGCGTASVAIKSGASTQATYTVTYTGTSTYGMTSLVTALKGTTAKGATLDLQVNIVKTGTTASASVAGNVTYGGKTYAVAGGSTTDSAAKTASWGYVITDTGTDITMTIAASYTSAGFSGAMTVQTKRGVEVATATVTSADGTVTVKYADGTTKTIEVFPDPTK